MPTMLHRGRALFILSLALLATASSAITLHIETTGTSFQFDEWDGGDLLLTADHTTFLAQSSSSALPPFTEASFALLRFGGGTDGSLIEFRDGTDNNAPDLLSVATTLDSDNTVGSVRTFGGAWSYSMGQGAYYGWSPKASAGRWSFAWNRADDTTRLVFDGDLKDRVETVPEPASFAALGVAAVALLRRKRR